MGKCGWGQPSAALSFQQMCPTPHCRPTCPSLRLSPLSTQPLLLICGPTAFQGYPLWEPCGPGGSGGCDAVVWGVGSACGWSLPLGIQGQPQLRKGTLEACMGILVAVSKAGCPKPGEAAVAHQPVTLGLGEGQEGLFLLARGLLSPRRRTLGNAGLCCQVEGSTFGSSDTCSCAYTWVFTSG